MDRTLFAAPVSGTIFYFAGGSRGGPGLRLSLLCEREPPGELSGQSSYTV